ncbi:energy-coupling factor ABC transporter ATP-binding protein [Nocardioides mangrovicus]|uniref:energy-coupling factor ABC transporter ATP-binding protein n=1 Tax=Nocardioides mangrovicus TaxID=2478913 RepID=UPI001E3413D3|nr:ABC transporter ATP-binding protein [Nocardioides mangrovicus]
MPLIELDGVSHAYGERAVLRDLTLRLEEHRIGVVGGNGSGKSTLARLLNGLVLPTAGRVRIDGLDTAHEGHQVRRRVGFVFTDPDAQIVMPTVGEDVAFGLRRLPRAEADRRSREWLERFGLADLCDHPAHLLSGGQKQLLALASVLVTEPDLLVMDEPTTLLDLANARHVAHLVAELPQQVVMVTHQLHLLDGFDRVLVVDDGRIVHDGPPADSLAHYEALVG